MTDTDDKLDEMTDRAEINTEKWGTQHPADVVLAMVEEIAEITEEMLENSEVSPDRPSSAERDLMHWLIEITVLGKEIKAELEEAYEDDQGTPLPVDERPRVLGDIEDSDPIEREVDDLAPLVVQLYDSLDEYSKW